MTQDNGNNVHQQKPLLEITSLTQVFGGIRALEDVGLSVNRGEIVAVIGPNGAGKNDLAQLHQQIVRSLSRRDTF